MVEEDYKYEDIMVTITGQTNKFRCHCNCNVFHHPEGYPNAYECNACGEWYGQSQDDAIRITKPEDDTRI